MGDKLMVEVERIWRTSKTRILEWLFGQKERNLASLDMKSLLEDKVFERILSNAVNVVMQYFTEVTPCCICQKNDRIILSLKFIQVIVFPFSFVVEKYNLHYRNGWIRFLEVSKDCTSFLLFFVLRSPIDRVSCYTPQ